MYNAKNMIDKSWNPIMNFLYTDLLVELNEKILSSISYQPTMKNIFRVFSMPINKIKIVILGQEPYSNCGNSVGYAFIKPSLMKKSPTLINIEKEIRDSGQINSSDEIDLFSWVDQGVFLLNTALTVETGKSDSHTKYWKSFSQRIISYISKENPCIWLMWGKKAQNFNDYIKNPCFVMKYKKNFNEMPITSDINYIINTPHPSSSHDIGFIGSNCFKKGNKILKKKRLKKIIW